MPWTARNWSYTSTVLSGSTTIRTKALIMAVPAPAHGWPKGPRLFALRYHEGISTAFPGRARLAVAEAEDGHEGLLRDLDVADPLHLLLTLGLLLEQLTLAADEIGRA